MRGRKARDRAADRLCKIMLFQTDLPADGINAAFSVAGLRHVQLAALWLGYTRCYGREKGRPLRACGIDWPNSVAIFLR
jgi:hypothetical protein